MLRDILTVFFFLTHSAALFLSLPSLLGSNAPPVRESVLFLLACVNLMSLVSRSGMRPRF